MAPTPNAIRIKLAAIPPYANTRFIVLLLSSAVTWAEHRAQEDGGNQRRL
jgi:hypothetical protein